MHGATNKARDAALAVLDRLEHEFMQQRAVRVVSEVEGCCCFQTGQHGEHATFISAARQRQKRRRGLHRTHGRYRAQKKRDAKTAY